MGFLKRLAFYLGLILGLGTVAAAGTVALTYLFTGRFPSVELSGEKPQMTLMTPDEVVALVREQAERARSVEPAGATEAEGGEDDE
jgi:hypothetical protein